MTVETPPDKGKCPFCGKRKRKDLQGHIRKRHPDGKTVVKADKRFDDSDPLVCRHCHKKQRNPTKLQQHLDKRHYEEERGLPKREPKKLRLRKQDRYADYEAQFSIFPIITVMAKGFNGARALWKEKRDALKELFGADEVNLIEVRMVGYDSEDSDQAEEPVVVEEGEEEDE